VKGGSDLVAVVQSVKAVDRVPVPSRWFDFGKPAARDESARFRANSLYLRHLEATLPAAEIFIYRAALLDCKQTLEKGDSVPVSGSSSERPATAFNRNELRDRCR